MAKENPDDIFHECETEDDIRQLARNYSYENKKLKATIKEMDRSNEQMASSNRELYNDLQAQKDQTGYALATLGKTFKITLTPKQGV